MKTPAVSVHRAVDTAELPEKMPKESRISGHPADSLRELWSRVGTEVSAGLWECTPGEFLTKREFCDEVVYIISGSGTLVHDDGTRSPHQAGDFVVIPDGWSGRWIVTTEIRKVYLTLPRAAMTMSPGTAPQTAASPAEIPN